MRVSNERVGTLIKINEGLDPWCVRRLAEDLRDLRAAVKKADEVSPRGIGATGPAVVVPLENWAKIIKAITEDSEQERA